VPDRKPVAPGTLRRAPYSGWFLGIGTNDYA
jgi:hypothetical protein